MPDEDKPRRKIGVTLTLLGFAVIVAANLAGAVILLLMGE